MDTTNYAQYFEPLLLSAQSLYALVSRVMGSLRTRLGRREGVRGYLTDQVLNKVEKVSHSLWESAMNLYTVEFFNILICTDSVTCVTNKLSATYTT